MAITEPLSMRIAYKYLMPLLGLSFIIRITWGDADKTWVIFPVLLAALYVSAAEIRMEGKGTSYRRFFSWKALPSDIVDVRCTLLPALGYIRFKHFVPPLGVMFFIVERGSGLFIPFRRNAFMEKMLSPSHLRESDVDKDKGAEQETGFEDKQFAWSLATYASMLAGIVMAAPWLDLSPSTAHGVVARYIQFLQNPWFLCSFSLLLVVILIREKVRSLDSVVLAYLLGNSLSFLLRVVLHK